MLLKAHELASFLRNDSLNVPWCDIFAFTNIHFLNKISVSDRKLAFCTVHTCLIQIKVINFKEEILHYIW